MNATIGVMNKRINSTKRTFSGQSHNVVLKDPVSRENPILYVTGTPMAHSNYMSFDGWYYWIDDIVSETNNTYRVCAHVDPLATWRDKIKSAKGLCNFAPKSFNGKKIVDSRLTPDIIATTSTKSYNSTILSSSGSIIMQIIDMSGNDNNGMQTICGSVSSYRTLLAQYATDLDADINNIAVDKLVGKMAGLGNALDSIKYAVYVPIDLNSIIGDTPALYGGGLGYYGITGTWYQCGAHQAGYPFKEDIDVTLSISAHSQDFPWLLSPKYTKLAIMSPGGQTDITDPTFLFQDVTELTFTATFGINIFGDCFITIKDADSKVMLASHYWNCAVDMKGYVYKQKDPIVSGIQAGLKIGAAGLSAIAGAGGALTSLGASIKEKHPIASDRISKIGEGLADMKPASSIVSGISGAVSSLDCSTDSRELGTPSNINCLYMISNTVTTILKFTLIQYEPYVVWKGNYEDWCEEYGYPCLNYISPSDDGPYQFASINIEADAPPASISTINSMCNSLIYIE